jgi:CubicO group peptidase (beta-lactamase class C family)
LVAVALGALIPGRPGAATAEPVPVEEMREAASAAMTASRLPSLSLAVSVDGTLVHAGAQGLADVENGVPATERTVYRIGSISKTLTAVAAMRLAEQGKLDLDAPVRRYCAAFPAHEHEPTARLLLGHLGGIRDYDYARFQEEFLSARRYATLGEALAVFKDDPLAAVPGARYRYSSFGYVLLGCVLEGASDVSYERYLHDEILVPAKMTQTVLDVPERIVPYRSRGYGVEEDGSRRNTVFVDLSDRFPAGGWLSTPGDLSRFAQALLAGQLVSAASLDRMWEVQRTAGGEPTGYGLGWRLAEGGCAVYHGGSSVGGSAYLYIRPDSKTVVAFATNLELWDEPRHELAIALAALAAGEGSCESP